MADLTTQSDRMIEDARRVRDDNRAGGRHRRAVSIGQSSAALKRRHAVAKAKGFGITVLAILAAVFAAGIVLDGIGFVGVMLAIAAIVAAVLFFAFVPKLEVPKRAELTKGDVRTMVGRTELWLEAQRPALPAPAARIVSDMGVRLDALGLQLAGVDQDHPKAREIRSLVGEQLPEMIDSYRRIPAHLRSEQRAGATPDQQITEGLAKIDREIDSITRQLAEGSLDDLAIKHRYLDYKFGEAVETAPELEHRKP